MPKAGTCKAKRKGPPLKEKGTLASEFRISVNIPGNREAQLRRVAERQGLALVSFIRQATLTRLDELDRDNG